MRTIAMLFVLFSVVFQGADVFAEIVNSRNQDVSYQVGALPKFQSLQNIAAENTAEEVFVEPTVEPLYSSQILPQAPVVEPKECSPKDIEMSSDVFSFLRDLPRTTAT